MGEATHSAEAMFALRQPTGRGGGRLYAGYLQIDDSETIDTGMDFVYALVTCTAANFAADTDYAAVSTVATTGVATMSIGQWNGPGTASAGSSHYVLAVGLVR